MFLLRLYRRLQRRHRQLFVDVCGKWQVASSTLSATELAPATCDLRPATCPNGASFSNWPNSVTRPAADMKLLFVECHYPNSDRR